MCRPHQNPHSQILKWKLFYLFRIDQLNLVIWLVYLKKVFLFSFLDFDVAPRIGPGLYISFSFCFVFVFVCSVRMFFVLKVFFSILKSYHASKICLWLVFMLIGVRQTILFRWQNYFIFSLVKKRNVFNCLS